MKRGVPTREAPDGSRACAKIRRALRASATGSAAARCDVELVAAAVTVDLRPYRPSYPGDLAVALMQSQMSAIERLEAVGGDLVRAGLGRWPGLYLIRHPDLIREVLIDQNDAVTKARGLRLAQRVLGRGLLTEEVPRHTRQRKLVLPAFHHGRLQTYARQMVTASEAEADRWHAGDPLDVAEGMTRLTLTIAGETLFGADVLASAERVSAAVREALRAFDAAFFPFSEHLMWLPLPANRRSKRARAVLDEVVYGMIGERRADGADGDDLLSMLLAAQDEDTGVGMTDEEVRDEVMTLLLAGHETTAAALTWTWALLAEHPEIEARLHAEVDALPATPSYVDLARLPYTRQVLAESMRLRPPAWVVGRQAARSFSLGDVNIEAGATLLFSSFFLHRDARFWPDPLRVDPERFTAEARAERHKFAYLPFSAGRRGCIGEQFAWMEGVLVLATLARRWRLRLAAPTPPPHGTVTLRPSGPVRMVATRR